MSEHNLWENIRKNLGHRGHWTRIEYNVVPGIPDTSYCLCGKEGFLELKYANKFPARSTTPVFGAHGLRDDQVVWIHNRTKHGGRVYILAQVEDHLFLVPGWHCRSFNKMTRHEFEKWSTAECQIPIILGEWARLYTALRR